VRRLRLPADIVRRLREELLQADEQERFAFLFAGSEDDLLGGRVVSVPDDAMACQSRTACRPSPAVERAQVGTCYDEGLAPVLVHSHPFSEDPRFSSIDIESMGRFREWLAGLFPDRSFGFAVVGTRGIEAVGDAPNRLQALPVEVIGEWKLDTPVPGARSRFALADQQADASEAGERSNRHDSGAGQERRASAGGRFDRNVRAFGRQGQRRLEQVTVGIVGVGGLGSLVAEQLARLGVEDLVLVDPDIVAESNLSRLAGAYDHHVGAPKVAAVREHLWQCGPDSLSIDAVQAPVQERTEVLDRCDIVVGAVDSVTARSVCNEYAVKQLTYYIDAGVRIDTDLTVSQTDGEDTAPQLADEQTIEMTGYVHLVAPGSNACFDCLGRHDQAAARIEQLSPAERETERERGYIDAEELTPEPALIHLNGLCASKSVSVLVDLVTGRTEPPDFIRYEDTAHEMTALTSERSANCPTCGTDGVLGVGRRSFGDAEFSPDEVTAESD
jgi:molybdopterin/thiamine biosynthesis adenylyltransferase